MCLRSWESGQSIRRLYTACCPSLGWAGSRMCPKTGLCLFGGASGVLPTPVLPVPAYLDHATPAAHEWSGCATRTPSTPSPCWCELTRCLPHLSPRRKVVLLSPGLRALVSWLLFSGWWWGVAFLRSAPQASSSYSLLISCVRERISVLLAPKCSLSSVSSL